MSARNTSVWTYLFQRKYERTENYLWEFFNESTANLVVSVPILVMIMVGINVDYLPAFYLGSAFIYAAVFATFPGANVFPIVTLGLTGVRALEPYLAGVKLLAQVTGTLIGVGFAYGFDQSGGNFHLPFPPNYIPQPRFDDGTPVLIVPGPTHGVVFAAEFLGALILSTIYVVDVLYLHFLFGKHIVIAQENKNAKQKKKDGGKTTASSLVEVYSSWELRKGVPLPEPLNGSPEPKEEKKAEAQTGIGSHVDPILKAGVQAALNQFTGLKMGAAYFALGLAFSYTSGGILNMWIWSWIAVISTHTVFAEAYTAAHVVASLGAVIIGYGMYLGLLFKYVQRRDKKAETALESCLCLSGLFCDEEENEKET